MVATRGATIRLRGNHRLTSTEGFRYATPAPSTPTAWLVWYAITWGPTPPPGDNHGVITRSASSVRVG
jgi:hypothetical protein